MSTTTPTSPSEDPDNTDTPTKPDDVDPKTGTDADDIPIDNPSG